jgi:hypothetical protein
MIPLGGKVLFGKSEEFWELLRCPTVRRLLNGCLAF